ncbi:MAG: BatD family protein [Bacteroidales bacterium]|nr:BatD family protein [Bacteroidales bacterium]
MKKHLLTILVTFLISLAAYTAHAQDDFYVDINVSNSSPSLNEQFRVDYILKYKGRSGSFNLSGINAKKPSFEKFRIIDEGGGMDMNMSFGFGRQEKDMALYKYSFILEPKEKGKFTIDPFVYKWQGKTLKSAELTITVSESDDVNKPSGEQQNKDGLKPDDLFARTIVSKDQAYVGEAVVVTHKLYSKKKITGLNAKNLPSFEGFWSKDIDIGDISVKKERVDGEIYNTITIGKKVLFPQKSGSLKIGSFSLDVQAEIIKTRKAQTPREKFFYGDQVRIRKNVEKNITSPVVSINVKPLPNEGKPANFSGLVGSYRMSANLTKDSIASNQAVNLKIDISGSGNIDLLELPEINFPPDFEVYEPEVNTKTQTNKTGVSGKKTFDYTLIPRSEGHFKISPIQFSYFDILKEEYVTLKTEAFDIFVGKGKEEDGEKGIVTYNKQKIQRLGKDIMHIYESSIPLYDKNKYFVNSWLFWLLLLLPPAGLLIFYLIHKKNRRIRADATLQKNRRATRLAKRRLKKARKLKDTGKQNEFYEEINKAILGYLSDRFNIPMAEVNRDNIQTKLENSNIKPDHIRQSRNILDQCDFARFAPESGEQKLEDIYTQTLNLISNIEKDLK